MEIQTSNLTIRENIFTKAEEELRGLVLEREKHADSPAVVEQLNECISLAESVLAWRRKFGAELSRSISHIGSHDDEPCDATRVAGVFNPVDKYLETVRLDLMRHYDERVSSEVRDWLQNWTLKVENGVLEKSLSWIAEAADLLSARQADWGALVRHRGGKRLGIFGKLRAFRLSKEYREKERDSKELDAALVAEQARQSKHLARTKISAGMLSVFLKVRAGSVQIDHRILKKVLELDRERDVQRHLEQRIADTRSRMAEIVEQRQQLKRDREEALQQRSRIESRKQMRLMEIYTRTDLDPCSLVMRATEVQINTTYAQVEKLIREELHEVELREKRCQKLDSEFQRLVGVVHEYQKATQSVEKDREGSATECRKYETASEHSGVDLCN